MNDRDKIQVLPWILAAAALLVIEPHSRARLITLLAEFLCRHF